jgi:N-acyl-D-amino-acid deacylase
MLAENYDADITLFDPDTVIDRATYENPRQFPSGIEWVIVNGEVVVENGKHTRAKPGRAIRSR